MKYCAFFTSSSQCFTRSTTAGKDAMSVATGAPNTGEHPNSATSFFVNPLPLQSPRTVDLLNTLFVHSNVVASIPIGADAAQLLCPEPHRKSTCSFFPSTGMMPDEYAVFNRKGTPYSLQMRPTFSASPMFP